MTTKAADMLLNIKYLRAVIRRRLRAPTPVRDGVRSSREGVGIRHFVPLRSRNAVTVRRDDDCKGELGGKNLRDGWHFGGADTGKLVMNS
jgi:hypothetical protein